MFVCEFADASGLWSLVLGLKMGFVDADADANADVLLLGLWVLLMVSGW